RLYMALRGDDRFRVVLEAFQGTTSEQRQRIIAAYNRNFGSSHPGMSFVEMMTNQTRIEEDAAIRHLVSDGIVTRGELMRVLAGRTDELGAQIGHIRAQELDTDYTGREARIAVERERFRRVVLRYLDDDPRDTPEQKARKEEDRHTLEQMLEKRAEIQ